MIALSPSDVHTLPVLDDTSGPWHVAGWRGFTWAVCRAQFLLAEPQECTIGNFDDVLQVVEHDLVPAIPGPVEVDSDPRAPSLTRQLRRVHYAAPRLSLVARWWPDATWHAPPPELALLAGRERPAVARAAGAIVSVLMPCRPAGVPRAA